MPRRWVEHHVEDPATGATWVVDAYWEEIPENELIAWPQEEATSADQAEAA